MRIPEIMQQGLAFSLEVFPPKTDEGTAELFDVLDDLYKLGPDFISCTYGSGGTNVGRNLDIVSAIQKSPNDVKAVTHFTCIGNTRAGVKQQLDDYLRAGVDHILALRGDLPAGWEGTGGDFNYATELVDFIRTEYGDRFSIAVAGSPEGHIEARSLEADIAHLRQKQDLGADYIMTQLTYDMEQFSYWLDAIRSAGIRLPVDVGVMPVLNKDATIKMCLSMNGCAIPHSLAQLISRYYDDPDGYMQAGIEYTIDQILEYASLGVDGIHIYALNKYENIKEIVETTGIGTIQR
jgi:methylenetetrahydrofolate reductase (NADPH)